MDKCKYCKIVNINYATIIRTLYYKSPAKKKTLFALHYNFANVSHQSLLIMNRKDLQTTVSLFLLKKRNKTILKYIQTKKKSSNSTYINRVQALQFQHKAGRNKYGHTNCKGSDL